MKYRYVSVYQIRGLIHNPDEGDIEIYSKEGDSSVRAILTGRPDEHCYELDRAQAVGYLMLKGMVGQREKDELKPEVENGIARIRDRRKEELGASETLVFVAEGEAHADFSQPNRETDDYVVGFDIINKKTIVDAYGDQVNAALAALCLAAEHETIQVKHVRGDVYLINELGKPLYSFEFSASFEGYSSRRTTSEIIREAQGQAVKLMSKRALSKVYRLLIEAVSRDNDELRRFMFGWSALEMLVNNVFSEYEKQFVQRLLEADPASHTHRYFKRIREVMKGKYNIADKFIVMAACIGDGSVETDIQEFIKIKKIRDALFHDKSVADKTLPTFATVELLKKYLRLHIKYKGRLTKALT